MDVFYAFFWYPCCNIFYVIDDKGVQPFKIGLIQPSILQMG
jgi:hypothetical protein